MGIKTHSCDILIVGGGLAGLQAAVTIQKKAPERKIVIADLGGGASSEIMGFCAPLVQGDSPEGFEENTFAVGKKKADPLLVKHLCHNAVSVVRDLERLGVEFDQKSDGSYDLLQSVGSSYPRVIHHKTTTGKVVMKKYHKILQDSSNVEFQKTRIVKLFKEDDRIAGALGSKDGKMVLYNTPCIVIASGGAAGLYDFSSWSKILRGNGYALASDIGVELTGMENFQFEPCVAVYPQKLYGFPIITTLLYEGAELRDGNGDSIINEPIPKREIALRIETVLSEGKGCEYGGVTFDFSDVDEGKFRQKYPEYYKKLGQFADSLSGLHIEVKPAAHTTLGGIKVDDSGATSVVGLFAAGEVIGGLHGADRIGGNAGLEIFVFGRTAGESAAVYKAFPVDVSDIAKDFLEKIASGTGKAKKILDELGNVLGCYCGVLRTQQKLAEGRNKLKELSEKLENNPPAEKEDYLACRQALLVAEKLCG